MTTTDNAGYKGPGSFWPYKLAGLLVHSELPGVKRLPGHVIVAPMPVLHKICPMSFARLKGHLLKAVDVGLLRAVTFHYSTAIIEIEPTPWEMGSLDVTGVELRGMGVTVPTHPPRVEERPYSEPHLRRIAEMLDTYGADGDEGLAPPVESEPLPLQILDPDYQARLLKGLRE